MVFEEDIKRILEKYEGSIITKELRVDQYDS